MPLPIPNRASLSRTLETNVRTELPELDPTPSRRSKIGAWVKSLASAIYDWFITLKDYAEHDPFPQTARGDFLLKGWWRAITKLDPIPASPATGYVCITGTDGTEIPRDATLSANNNTYTIQSASAVVMQSLIVISAEFTGGKCILQTSSPHLLGDGIEAVISGASLSEFNGTFNINVTDEDEITYTPADDPVGTPTGDIRITATYGVAPVKCNANGQLTNVSSGGTLTLDDDISGVESVIATFGGIQGGADKELAEAYRTRILQALGTDFGAFSADEIEILVRAVPGVTDVWVIPATQFGSNGVNEGQVKVAFLRRGDGSPIPSAREAEEVHTALVSNIMTANTAPEDVMVMIPVARYIDFDISITPDTITMRQAVRAGLKQFFDEQVTYEQDILLDDLKCVIKATFDIKKRQKLTSYSIVTPSATIDVLTNEMPLLGEVTFS
jgi:uncharacterized phage protein gp47/JayE